jgi:hypothetical protein
MAGPPELELVPAFAGNIQSPAPLLPPHFTPVMAALVFRARPVSLYIRLSPGRWILNHRQP